MCRELSARFGDWSTISFFGRCCHLVVIAGKIHRPADSDGRLQISRSGSLKTQSNFIETFWCHYIFVILLLALHPNSCLVYCHAVSLLNYTAHFSSSEWFRMKPIQTGHMRNKVMQEYVSFYQQSYKFEFLNILLWCPTTNNTTFNWSVCFRQCSHYKETMHINKKKNYPKPCMVFPCDCGQKQLNN